MSKQQKRRRPQTKKSGFNWRSLVLLLVGLGVVGGFVWWLSGGHWWGSEEQANLPIGPVTECQKPPKFLSSVGFSQQVLIDTTQKDFIGVALRDVESGQTYQDPAWDDIGNVGPHAIDKLGYVYVAPVPQVSLYRNPPEEQNKIFRIDTNTGKMAEYINLPWAQPPSGNNPFGVVGLTYDCDTHSLYAATVAGSTPKEQLGRIFQIDLNTGEIVDQFQDVDALGLGVFNGAQGKRLYYGSARAPDLFSIPLDSGGNFNGDPRFELSLAAQKGGSYDNGHRIRFTRDNQMEVKAIEFGYRLLAASDPLRNVYTFNYKPESDSWELDKVELQQ